MSSSQWEALPQRTRKRRSVVGNPPPYPPEQQQQQQMDSATLPLLAGRMAMAASAEPAPGVGFTDSHGHQQSQQQQQRQPSSSSFGCSRISASEDAAAVTAESESKPPGQRSQQPLPKQRQQDQQEQPNPRLSSSSPLDDSGGASRSLAKHAAAADDDDDDLEAFRNHAEDNDGSKASEIDKYAGELMPKSATAADAASGAAASVVVSEGMEVEGRGSAGDGGMSGLDTVVGEAAAVAARHAAVAMEVDARSKMTRFSGGLEGGAGADGGTAGANFEYLDHTADIQLHSWGDSIERAMEGALAAMFNTITDIAKVDVNPAVTREMEIEGHDPKSLLFNLLDEFLFLFHSEGLAVKRTTVHGTVDRGGDGPRPRWRLRATAEGETFDLSKHPQGTEVKAITYSNMQINETPGGRTDIYVIVDI